MNDCAPPPTTTTETTPRCQIDVPRIVRQHARAREGFVECGLPVSEAAELAAEFVAAWLIGTDHGRKTIDEDALSRFLDFIHTSIVRLTETPEDFVASFTVLACAGIDDDAVERQVRIVRRLVGLAPVPARPTGHAPVAFLPHPAAFSLVSGVTLPLCSSAVPL